MFCAALLIYLFIQAARSYWRKKSFDKELIICLAAGAGILIIIFGLKWDEMVSLMRYALAHKGMATSFPSWVVSAAKGSFINISTFYYLNLIILPFALFSLLHPAIWSREALKKQPVLVSTFYIIFLGLFILSLFPVLRQQRFIILLDIFLMIFAVPSFSLLMDNFIRNRLGKVFLILFIAVFTIRIGSVVWAQQPQLYNSELREIKALATLTEPKARIMTTSNLYTPWVKGYSERPTFGPGLEQELLAWDFQTWMNFWNGGNDEERLQLFMDIPGPLYIFVGKNENINLKYQQFIRNDVHFLQISSQVWKFVP